MTQDEKGYLGKLSAKQLADYKATSQNMLDKAIERSEALAKEASEESKRHMNVLIEHSNSNIEGIAEQYTDIKATLDMHTKILTANQEILLEHDRAIKELQRH